MRAYLDGVALVVGYLLIFWVLAALVLYGVVVPAGRAVRNRLARRRNRGALPRSGAGGLPRVLLARYGASGGQSGRGDAGRDVGRDRGQAPEPHAGARQVSTWDEVSEMEPWMDCTRCGEWQTKHDGPCDHCGAPNSALRDRHDDGEDPDLDVVLERDP